MKFKKEIFSMEGFQMMRETISEKNIKAMKEQIVLQAKHEEESNDNCFYENKETTTGNMVSNQKKMQRVWNLCNKGKIFQEILENEEILYAMNEIFKRNYSGDKFRLSSMQANILYPGAHAQKLHIDTPFPEPLPKWPVKANCIILIDEFTIENGATEVVPKSHTNERKPKPYLNDERKLEILTGNPGDVLLTHGNLWHRSGNNNTNKNRIAVLCSFCASFINQIAYEENHWQNINRKIALSEATKKLMGYYDGLQRGARNFQ